MSREAVSGEAASIDPISAMAIPAQQLDVPSAPTTVAPKFRLVFRDSVGSFGWCGNLMLCVGREPPDPLGASNYAESVRRISALYPNGIGVLTVIQSRSTPEPAARDLLVGTFKKNWGSIRGALFVVEAQGFAAAIQRSVLSAFMLAAGVRDQIKVTTPASCDVSWLTERAAPDMNAAAIKKSMTQFIEKEREPGEPFAAWPRRG